MNPDLDINVDEAIEVYCRLVKYNKMNGFEQGNPSCMFAEQLRDFLLENGVLV